MSERFDGGDASRRLIKLEEREKSNTHRLDRLEGLVEEVHAQNENIARLLTELEYTNKQLSLHDARLSEIEKQPRTRLALIWSSVITAIVGAAVGAVMTAVISSI